MSFFRWLTSSSAVPIEPNAAFIPDPLHQKAPASLVSSKNRVAKVGFISKYLNQIYIYISETKTVLRCFIHDFFGAIFEEFRMTFWSQTKKIVKTWVFVSVHQKMVGKKAMHFFVFLFFSFDSDIFIFRWSLRGRRALRRWSGRGEKEGREMSKKAHATFDEEENEGNQQAKQLSIYPGTQHIFLQKKQNTVLLFLHFPFFFFSFSFVAFFESFQNPISENANGCVKKKKECWWLFSGEKSDSFKFAILRKDLGFFSESERENWNGN